MPKGSILLMLSVVASLAFACGSDRAPPMADPYGTLGGAGGGSSECRTYCTMLVTSGANCQSYNDGGHCEQVCGWYQATVCNGEHAAFISCMRGASSVSCYQSTSGTWGLNIPMTCSTPFTTFQDCVHTQNVGVCPYGS